MKSNMFLKLCAVASSLLLAAGFVSYRAGALDWMQKPDPTVVADPVAPESISVDVSMPNTVVLPVDTEDRQLFYGSKSGVVFEPETTPVPVPPVQELPAEEAVLFSGSKSLMPGPAPSQK